MNQNVVAFLWLSLLPAFVLANVDALRETSIRQAAMLNEQKVMDAEFADRNWLLYGRTYDEKRFSPLKQITPDNVGQLGLLWHFDTGHNRGLESTPIAIDGVLYTTGSWSIVYAHDAKTGELLWQYDPQVDKSWAVYACCDVVNRGVAVWQGKVIVGTLDGRLVAIDAGSGEKIWETLTIDKSWPYTITGAPRIIDGKVLIGNGGAEYGVRGYVSAYDANTGKKLWRFYTVPGNPADGFEDDTQAMAAKTWSGQWWKDGGGGTVWDSMAYDPELDLVYIGVGNAAPWNRYIRNPEGLDNLFVASIVALRPDTGEYVWHYQEVPNDGFDYTATQHMILADIEWQGEARKVILHAPKNGFFFIIDRITGELLSAEPYVKVNWASGYDANGRPIETKTADYSQKKQLIRPSSMGAHSWHPMSYSEQTGYVYIPVMDTLAELEREKNYQREHGFWNLGVNLFKESPGELLFQDIMARKITRGRLVAWNPEEQQEVWRVEHPLTWNGGVLSTAANLVFQGTADGRFVAYRADNGEKLWEFETQTGVIAPPVTYVVDGEQYITIQVGWGGAFGLAGGLKPISGTPKSRTLTFKLGGNSILPPADTQEVIYDPPPRTGASVDMLADGSALYHRYCVGCHGMAARSGGGVPDLRYMHSSRHQGFNQIVLGGALRGLGMVSFAEVLSQEDADAVYAYIVEKANEAKELRENPGAEWWIAIKTWVYEKWGDVLSRMI